LPKIEPLNPEAGDGVSMSIPPEKPQIFKVGHGEGAAEDKTYDKYRLSEGMQSATSTKTGCSTLTFPGDRYKIQEAVMQRAEKKRRVDTAKSEADR
jgi:hypothetical protein